MEPAATKTKGTPGRTPFWQPNISSKMIGLRSITRRSGFDPNSQEYRWVTGQDAENAKVRIPATSQSFEMMKLVRFQGF
jgi:hypothetical protein